MSFTNKRVFITGAGRGLGAAFAVCLADAGAAVILTGRNKENLTSLAESIKRRVGKRPQTMPMDLADISQVTLSAKKMRDEGVPLDILINNGASWLSGAMTSHDAYSIANTITGNVTGTLLLTRGLLPLLEKSGAGDIVNIISTSGMHNVSLQGASVAYIASKHGQAGMTDALRQELRGRPVRISAIYPPQILNISPLDADAWNAVPDKTSWPTNRDIVESAMFALTRPRHLTVACLALETDTGNFHGRQERPTTLKDQVAIITGGGPRGSSLACARCCAAQGAEGIMADGLDDVGRGKAKRLGATDMQCNVSNCTDAKATVSAVMEAFGRVDTLMNKAAICISCKVLEISQADHDRMMHTDRQGSFLMLQARAMLAQVAKARPPGAMATLSWVNDTRVIPTIVTGGMGQGRPFLRHAGPSPSIFPLTAFMAMPWVKVACRLTWWWCWSTTALPCTA